MMVRAGMSAEQVLRSATGGAARCMGLEEVGTLTPGKWADFLVLEADPLGDIRNVRTFESVWIGGRRRGSARGEN
jgi:imidazolonepropionase-like amidohydrolase